MGKSAATSDFTVAVDGVKGVCPAGEAWAKQNIAENRVPVFSCEGPCIRGEIARLAANLVAKEMPGYARCCYAEAALVPYSTMARWTKAADEVVVIDGCFLTCVRIVQNLVDEEKIVQIDALPYYKKYTDVFLMDDVPEQERKAVARQVADKILAKLRKLQARGRYASTSTLKPP